MRKALRGQSECATTICEVIIFFILISSVQRERDASVSFSHGNINYAFNLGNTAKIGEKRKSRLLNMNRLLG
jgi:hypothetical protein